MKSSAQVKILGSGDAFDPKYGNSSYLYTFEGQRVLIDCGYAAAAPVMALPECNEIDVIVITHLHGDHYFGLPILFGYYSLRSQRRKPLTIVGPPELSELLPMLAERAYPSAVTKAGFAYSLLDIRNSHVFGELSLDSAEVRHAVPTWALRLSARDLRVAFSADGSPTPASLDLYVRSQHLFHECFTEHPTGPTHCSFDEIEEKICPFTELRSISLVHIAASEREKVRARLKDARYIIPEPGDTLILSSTSASLVQRPAFN